MGVGGWDRIGSGFVDEGFDWLRDGKRASPTVRLKMSALGNRRLAMIDPLVTRDDFVSIHWHEIFAKALHTPVFITLATKTHEGTTPNHNRLRILPRHRGFQTLHMLQVPLHSRRKCAFMLLEVESRDLSHPASYRASVNFSLNSISAQGRYGREKLG
jgi:hypothetical protein